MRRPLHTSILIAALVAALGVALAACGGGGGSSGASEVDAESWDAPVKIGGDQWVPIIVSTDLVAGEKGRMLFAIQDGDQEFVSDPDMPVDVAFYDLDESKTEPVSETEASFLWAVPDERGMYEVPVDFAEAGVWGAVITARPGEGDPRTMQVRFDVKSEPLGLGVGDPAPDTPTKTAADAAGDLSTITTDDDPDPALYEMSVPQALAADKPFVVVFGTPKFCTSQTCAPTLDTVKRVRPDETDTNFMHVEIYENLKSAQPTLVPAVGAWKLRSEPWVFVVGSDGKIAHRFEGAVSESSLREAIEDTK